MRRSWNYKTNASWTGQIGVKTMILQAFYCSGKSVINLKMYFSYKPEKLRFQNRNAYSGSMPRTTGSNRWKLEVSLSKIDPEGVLSFLSRWSRNERLGLDGGGKRSAGRRSWGWRRRCCHCRGGELTSVGQTSATVNHFRIGNHWDEAGTKANSVGYISWAEDVLCGVHHGRRWRELAGTLGEGHSSYDSQN
jgi:hypothetical protein